ncbi:MotA/TolQ/ExbB proton channel family protein [Desulfovibrio ferrophilus]|uniref:MotA/TolQ/ExbB proton channel n=1 Tax=Desulfovibrio ferrophilus TaxID=241368 RepID=A0A2Z6AYN5_9BACT|nr:MotA/TolQ/ExbB proton channel family protein [Desulfovibrio ferrophilus]BBD08338.1 MotA/TolQ/ExbB proton channel [Desulfovibrio ferrophilus]
MDAMPQIGIFAMLTHATLTVKFVLGLLIFMSLTSWSVILFKYFALSSARKRAAEDLKQFQSASSLEEGMRGLSQRQSSPLYQSGIPAVNELRRLDASGVVCENGMSVVVMENLDRALKLGVGAQLKELSKSMAFLATCGNSAPFIGLFGTVWGIMHAFHSIGQMKTAALAAVAPGISEALIATAVGLAVAIPATIAYNFFLGALSAIETELNGFAGSFLNAAQREMSSNANGKKD